MADKELKACPFCGSTAETCIIDKVLHARCTESKRKKDRFLPCCGANDVWIDVKTWNHRQPDKELVEALEEIARYTHGSTNRKAEYVNAQATKALDKYKGKE